MRLVEHPEDDKLIAALAGGDYEGAKSALEAGGSPHAIVKHFGKQTAVSLIGEFERASRARDGKPWPEGGDDYNPALDAIKLLDAHGGNMMEVDIGGHSLLNRNAGNYGVLSYLNEHHPEIKKYVNGAKSYGGDHMHGTSPLTSALFKLKEAKANPVAQQEVLRCVGLLCEMGANPLHHAEGFNQPIRDANALQYSAETRDLAPELTECMIQAGLKRGTGHKFLVGYRLPLEKERWEKMGRDGEVLLAASERQYSDLRRAIQNGGNPNAEDDCGLTPIMKVDILAKNAKEQVQFLTENGADVMHVTPDGRTVLHVFGHNPDVLEYLRDNYPQVKGVVNQVQTGTYPDRDGNALIEMAGWLRCCINESSIAPLVHSTRIMCELGIDPMQEHKGWSSLKMISKERTDYRPTVKEASLQMTELLIQQSLKLGYSREEINEQLYDPEREKAAFAERVKAANTPRSASR